MKLKAVGTGGPANLKCWECGVPEGPDAVMHPTIIQDRYLCGPCWQSEKMMYAREEADDRKRDFPEDQYHEPRS